MRVAVISDIHANLPALEAVLEEVEGASPDELWCLGDVVGYGAQPDACTESVGEACDTCLVGNHDLAVLGQLDVDSFSAAAADAVRWTRDNATAATSDFLSALEPKGERAEVGLYHASPRDPVWEYVLATDQASECLDVQPQRVCLIGHSHIALFFTRPDGEREAGGPDATRGAQADGDVTLDLGEGEWLINPGSVGQPRDGDPRAAWLELDTGEWTARYHRTSYDIDRAAEPIVAAGLPRHLADRLYIGQ
jgi:predicted phosphodiesterase